MDGSHLKGRHPRRLLHSTPCGSILAREPRPSPGRSSVTPGSSVSYPQPLSVTMFETSARQPIRVGVIGTGFGASLHLSALRENPDFQTAAICSRRPERARAAALDHGIPAHLSDYRELVR